MLRRSWVSGFEEQENWQERKSPTGWIFDLWVQLKKYAGKREQAILREKGVISSTCWAT